MSGEATDLVALKRLANDLRKFEHHPVGSLKIDMDEVRKVIAACDLIEAQAAEIEEAHQIISDLRDDDNDWRVMTPDQRRRSDAFLASRTERADG